MGKSPHTKIYKCKMCGAEFCLLVRPRHPKLFCSKKCQKEHLRQHPSLPKKIHKFQTKEEFVAAASEVIINKKRYVTQDEIARHLHVCGKEFKRLNVDIVELNKSLGMKKLPSILHGIIATFLREFFDDVETEATFEDFISPNGMVLRYDIRVESQKLLVEVDGSMHQKGHAWYSEYRNYCSQLKDTYARTTGYTLIRIPVGNVRDFDESSLYAIFADYLPIMGNQQPEHLGISANGSETDSVSRTDTAAAS